MNREPTPPSVLPWMSWLVVSVAVVLLAPSWVGYGAPVWEADRSALALGLAAVQLAASLVIVGSAIRDRPLPAPRVVAMVGALLGGVYLAVLVLDQKYSRAVLLVGSALVFLLCLLPSLWRSSRKITVLLGLVVSSGLVWIQFLGGQDRIERMVGLHGDEEVRDSFTSSAYHTIRDARLDDFLPPDHVSGGAIATLDDGYLLVSGSGRFFHLSLTSGTDAVQGSRLDLQVPLNWEAFDSAVGEDVTTFTFRTADLLVETSGDSLSLLVSHHRWKEEERCYVIRVSRLETTRDELLRGGDLSGTDPWETFYETEPCLPVKDTGLHRFAGLIAGGRLARLDDERLLFSVGDHEFDGWNAEAALSQQPSSDYGKILVLGPDGERSIFSMGHRNPQGLYIGFDGTIWSTEHGPEGGDELNLVQQGGNYGWPYATLGTEYGGHRWPLADSVTGDFKRPAFAWTPSIGISNLIAVRDSLFERWQGDLLVASLVANSLYRTRVRDGRVINVEEIEVGGRVRDLVEGPEGQIALYLDGETVVFLSPSTLADDGAAVFAAECSGCHTAGEATAKKLGPDLRGIFGQRIGSREDYDYSESLASKDGTWTEANLDRFLADPQEFVPGTKMRWDGIADPERRRALIAYLEGL